MARNDGKMAAKYMELHIKTFKQVLIDRLLLTEEGFKMRIAAHR
jgi:hypothetical protein